MKKYGIIADDLTGAGDTGVQFAKVGIPTRVVMGDWSKISLHDVSIVTVNTDSRFLSSEKAYEIVRSEAKSLMAHGVLPFFKKIDSTLRGNIAVEIDAMADEIDAKVIILCPAFPDNGRTVIHGELLVNGVPVSRTAMGRDPGNPVTQSYIPEIIKTHSSRRIKEVSYDDISKGAPFLEKIFKKEIKLGSTVFVCDAISSEDLKTISTATFSLKERALFAGTGALGIEVARILVDLENFTIPDLSEKPKVLCVVGSVNPVSREQLQKLKQNGNWLEWEIPENLLLSDRSVMIEAAIDSLNLLKESLKTAEGVLLSSPGNSGIVQHVLKLASEKGLDQTAATQYVAVNIAEATKIFLDTHSFGGVFVTGGDIARAIFEKIEAQGLDVQIEVSPGIPLGLIPSGEYKGTPIVTKAGGFGSPDAIVQSVKIIQNSVMREK